MLERVQFFLLKEGGVCLYIFFGRKSLGGLRCRRAQTVGTGDGTNWLQIAAATRGWGWYLVFVQGFGNRRIYRKSLSYDKNENGWVTMVG